MHTYMVRGASKLQAEGTQAMGPWGGTGGDPWSLLPPVDSRLTRIQIRYMQVIDAFRFEYEREGELHWSEKWGDKGGLSQSEIALEQGEYITFVLGHYGVFFGNIVVESLTLISNIKKYGPYGMAKGTFFCLPHAGSNMVVGFFGRSGLYLDAIGVYWIPIHSKISGGSAGNVPLTPPESIANTPDLVVPPTAPDPETNTPTDLLARLKSWIPNPGASSAVQSTMQLIIMFMIVTVMCVVAIVKLISAVKDMFNAVSPSKNVMFVSAAWDSISEA